MKNTFRSKTFLRIKQVITNPKNNARHIEACRQMIENATPIIDRDELTILLEYFSDAKNRYFENRHKSLSIS